MRFLPPPMAVALAALVLPACVKNLPNTDIRDTEDNRAIIGVVDAYRKAFDARDVQGVMALVSPSYYDDAGTVDASDDVDYKTLPVVLQETFSRLASVRIEMGITAINVTGDTANVDMFYDAKYRVATPRNEIPKRDTDVQRIVMKKEGGVWRIVTGL